MVTSWSFLISHFLHLYTSEQALKLKKTATSIAGFGEVDDLSCNSLGMTSIFIIQALSTWLVKIVLSQHVLL
jgi:hypothetical protein